MLIYFDLFCNYRTNYIFAENLIKLSEEIKTELIEELAAHHAEASKLPPLAAKIFAYILVNCNKEGYTFDELVETFNVSKSSVSNSLNLLVQYDFIGQYNKIGERKRRYKITPQHLTMRLKKIRSGLTQEKYLSEKLTQYRLNYIQNPSPMDLEKGKIYVNHLENSINRLTETIEKIEKLTHTL